MTTLESIIEEKALNLFRKESKSENITDFMLKNADLTEFANYMKEKKIAEEKIGKAIRSGVAEFYCQEVLWGRLKPTYIKRIVEEIEKRISISEVKDNEG